MKNKLNNPEFIFESLKILSNLNLNPIFNEIQIEYEKHGFLSDRQTRYLKANLPKYQEYLSNIEPKQSNDSNIKITLSNNIAVYNPPESIQDYIKQTYTIKNPKWFENHRMGRWNGKTPKMLEYYKQDENLFYLPIGCIEDIEILLKDNSLNYSIKDNRITNPVKWEFKQELRDIQLSACNDILKHDIGTLIAPTGAGKTVCALYICSERKQKTLIIVHTVELLNQWIDRAVSFLNTSKESIGIIGNGQFRIGSKLTIALVQSCYKKIDFLKNKFGMVIIDESHRCPSRQFIDAVHFLNAKYKLGLTATPKRSDKLEQLIFWYLGPIRHEIDKKELIDQGHIVMPQFKFINTGFVTSIEDIANNYSKMLSELTKDETRNNQIIDDINNIDISKTSLIISDRKNHLFLLHEGLKNKYGKTGEILIGSTKPDERKRIVHAVNTDKCKWLFATGQLIGEGFDCKNLDNLFICTPIKFAGRVTQYIGRIMRPGKTRPMVYDYVDVNINALVNSAKSRSKVYGKENII